jgi:hypothetical protein
MHRALHTCHPIGLARQVRLGVLACRRCRHRRCHPRTEAVLGYGVEPMTMAGPTSVAAGRKIPELA